MYKIFVRFTIQGDELDVSGMLNDIPIQADVFIKGAPVITRFNNGNKTQKTNRWVYSIESQGDGVNSVLQRMRKELHSYKDKLAQYTKKHASLLDIVIYENSDKPLTKFNLSLSKTNLKFVVELNTKVSLTVFDW